MRALDRPLGAVTRLSAGGGALPVIMSIIGPRETHDYRNYNLLGSGTIQSKKQNKKTVNLDASCQLVPRCTFSDRTPTPSFFLPTTRPATQGEEGDGCSTVF